VPEPIAFEPRRVETERSAEEELQTLIQTLHDHGLLHLAQVGIDGGMDALAVLLERVDNPSTHRTLENLARLAKLPGTLDPMLLEAVSTGLQEAGKVLASHRTPTLVSIVRSIFDPKVRRGIALALAFARGVGSTSSRTPSP
jgi:uncharacterized protein YjgD (DUF1641 family)